MPLIIHGSKVNNISGPVSMYILTPKSISSNLPVYMLFGDIHKSNKNMCDYTTKGIYKNIFDIDFLSLLTIAIKILIYYNHICQHLIMLIKKMLFRNKIKLYYHVYHTIFSFNFNLKPIERLIPNERFNIL